MSNKARIRLSHLEKSWYSQVYELFGCDLPFWLVERDPEAPVGSASGEHAWLAGLLKRFGAQVLFVEVGEPGRHEPSPSGVLDLRGQADFWQLVRLIYHAQGVLYATSRLRHLAQTVETKPGAGGARPCVPLASRQAGRQLSRWCAQHPESVLTPAQRQRTSLALPGQRPLIRMPVLAPAARLLERVFAVACDAKYLPGLRALLNSIAVYHGRDVPLFLYHRGLSAEQLHEVLSGPLEIHPFAVDELPFACTGMWEAKQQVLAHALGRARQVYLLDADLVLVSNVEDVFELASVGKIVSSVDGGPRLYGAQYGVYHPDLPGTSQPYINSGALCLDVVRHWELAGLWAFAAQYGAYRAGGGRPLKLPGHGDQGVLNALSALLRKTNQLHLLPEGTWCDSTRGCTLRIRGCSPDGRLQVWNATENAPHWLLHSSGPKWWTWSGATRLRRFGDKLQCFRHFASLQLNSKPWSARVRVLAPPRRARKTRTHLLVGVCSFAGGQARRAAIRSSWLKTVPPGVRAVFFTGAGVSHRERGVVALPVEDGYISLPRKVQAFFHHALEAYAFDYLFKCDDDTYVCLDRLLELTRTGGDYVGSAAWESDGYASGGAGYLLSRKAVELLARTPSPVTGAEDVWVGYRLREAGIPLCATPRLQFNHEELPHVGNDFITAHWCSPDLMRTIQKGLATPGATHTLARFFARHTLWEGPLRLLQDGSFVGGGEQPHGRWQLLEGGSALLLNWYHWPSEVLHRTTFGFAGVNLRLETIKA